MCKVAVRGLLVVALSAMSVAPALAFGWEWLEELSGPGKFVGFAGEFKLACYYEPVPKGRNIERDNQDGTAQRAAFLAPGMSTACLTKNKAAPKNWRTRVYAAGIGTRWLWSMNNDLDYVRAFRDSERTVRLNTVHMFSDFRLAQDAPRVHLGFALGAARFSGKPFEDNAFWRPTVEGRLTLKLWELQWRGKSVGTFDVRTGVIWFLGKLTAEDFGAVGDYRVRNEGVPFVTFMLDFN